MTLSPEDIGRIQRSEVRWMGVGVGVGIFLMLVGSGFAIGGFLTVGAALRAGIERSELPTLLLIFAGEMGLGLPMLLYGLSRSDGAQPEEPDRPSLRFRVVLLDAVGPRPKFECRLVVGLGVLACRVEDHERAARQHQLASDALPRRLGFEGRRQVFFRLFARLRIHQESAAILQLGSRNRPAHNES